MQRYIINVISIIHSQLSVTPEQCEEPSLRHSSTPLQDGALSRCPERRHLNSWFGHHNHIKQAKEIVIIHNPRLEVKK